MKYLRILPEMWASTTCSFSSSTLNMALGRVSTTVPVTSIASAFPALGPSEAGLVPCLFFFLFPVRKRGRYGRLAIHSSPLQKSSRGQRFNSSSKTPQTLNVTGFSGDYQPIRASVRVPGSTFHVPRWRAHCRGCRKRGKPGTEPGALATGELLNCCENWSCILPSLTFGAPLSIPSTFATPSVIRASACPATGQAGFETRPEAARKADSQGTRRGRNDSDCAGDRASHLNDRPGGREEQ